jgi:hypothetical protein
MELGLEPLSPKGERFLFLSSGSTSEEQSTSQRREISLQQIFNHVQKLRIQLNDLSKTADEMEGEDEWE